MSTSLYLQAASLEIRRLAAYRADFWANFMVSMFARVTVAYFLWSAIFQTNEISEIGGYQFHELILYYLLVGFTFLLLRSGTFAEFANEIFEGAFTRYILYPLPVLRYWLAMYLGRLSVFTIPMTLGFGLYVFFFPLSADSTFGWRSCLQGFIALYAAAVLFFHLRTCIELCAFWVEQVWTLLLIEHFLTSLLGGSMLPLSLFPPWATDILKYLPFQCLVSFPVGSFLGTISPSEWWFSLTVTFVWTGFFLLLAELLLARGKYRYTGVGI